jgi:hypothetical protein
MTAWRTPEMWVTTRPRRTWRRARFTDSPVHGFTSPLLHGLPVHPGGGHRLRMAPGLSGSFPIMPNRGEFVPESLRSRATPFRAVFNPLRLPTPRPLPVGVQGALDLARVPWFSVDRHDDVQQKKPQRAPRAPRRPSQDSCFVSFVAFVVRLVRRFSRSGRVIAPRSRRPVRRRAWR